MKTREIILQSASDLIKVKGYYGTGIKEITEKSKIPKGSLYHFFPGGKDEVIESALEESAIQMSIRFKNTMKGKGSAEKGLMAIIDLFIEDLKRTRLRHGCPLAAVSMDISMENEEMRKTCSRLFQFWIDAVAGYLEYKKVDDSKDKAEQFLIQLEGAVLLSRVQQSDRPLKLVQKNIPLLINM